MDTTKFEQLVSEGVVAIPEKFRDALDNVSLFVEQLPTYQQARKLRLRRGHTLFGLYEGVPLTKRQGNYFGVLPDKITIFQLPIESIARTEEDVKRIVTDTVWHEIAHHFGMSEEEVRAAEKRYSRKR